MVRIASRSLAAVAAVALLVPMPVAGAIGPQALAPGSVDPATLDFGVLTVGTSALPRGVTYTNVNSEPVTILSVEVVSNAAYGHWTVVQQDCVGTPIPAGGACHVYVGFGVGWGEGTWSGTLAILDGSPTGALVALRGASVAAPANVAWQTPRTVPGSGTNSGSGLAFTASSSAEYFHTVFTGDTVSGVPVGDSGPYRLVAYTRSSNDGLSWRTPVRLNPATQHGTDPTIASSGTDVHVAWVRLTRASLGSSGPRVLYVRSNRSHGSGTWRSAVRVTSTTGRVIGPRIAAAENRVFVAFTDGATGAVRIVRSIDRGTTWRTTTVGSTSRGTSGWKDAGVAIAASGDRVIVSWISSTSGTVKARVSTDGGASWRTTTTVGSGADPGTAMAATADRSGTSSYRLIAAWIDGTSVRIGKTSSGSTWALSRTSPGPSATAYLAVRAIALVDLPRDDHVGLAMVACHGSCDRGNAAYAADLVWRETGSSFSWRGPSVLATTTSSVSDIGAPSVTWPAGGPRLVAAPLRSVTTDLDRLVVRTGIGVP